MKDGTVQNQRNGLDPSNNTIEFFFFFRSWISFFDLLVLCLSTTPAVEVRVLFECTSFCF